MPRHIVLIGQGVDVVPGADDLRVLQFTDQVTGDVVRVPLSPEVAGRIGAKLSAPSVEVARSMPPNGGGKLL